MIIDTVALSGLDAYLRDGNEINLATSPAHTGTSIKVTKGSAMSITALNLFIEGDDLLKHYTRPDPPDPNNPNAQASDPLLSISVKKEMFPGLFADPFEHRVHNISGYEDFKRGMHGGLRVMEVEGIATLVSVGDGSSRWSSPVYRMHRPISLVAAAWDLATSRLTPSDAFNYRLDLEIWTSGQNVETDPPTSHSLASSSTPNDPRYKGNLTIKNVIAYRILFGAEVKHDTFMHEFQYGPLDPQSIGRPLLRAVNLLEPIESTHMYYSLNELEIGSAFFNLFDVPAPPRRLAATVGFTALLNEDEEITLKVHQAGLFKRLEARLVGEVRLRPPMIDKTVGGPT